MHCAQLSVSVVCPTTRVEATKRIFLAKGASAGSPRGETAKLLGPLSTPRARRRHARAMRFSFCGGLDVPDWVRTRHASSTPPPPLLSACARPQLLSEIFVVSKISAVRIKLLAAHVVQQALGMDAPLEKAAKLLGDAKLEPPDIKAVVSALHFILCSAARYNVPDDTLAFELQQLGLPREHTEALTHALREGRAALQQHFAACSLQLPRLSSLTWQVPLGAALALPCPPCPLVAQYIVTRRASPWQVHEDTSHVAAHTVELRLGVTEQKRDAAQARLPPTFGSDIQGRASEGPGHRGLPR